MDKYISSGSICVSANGGITYNVARITYELSKDGSFKYTFVPNYSVISLLDSEEFGGIPGLNLDLRKKEYVRENTVPVFISERVPSENREDYRELLERAGMDYMDPIQYLIKTKEQYSGDNLFVEAEIINREIGFENYIENISSGNYIRGLLTEIALGNTVLVNGGTVDDSNRKLMHAVLLLIYQKSREYRKEKQAEGIAKAKSEHRYKGRKPIEVDRLEFMTMIDRVERNEITAREAADRLHISIDKYYRFKKNIQSDKNKTI